MSLSLTLSLTVGRPPGLCVSRGPREPLCLSPCLSPSRSHPHELPSFLSLPLIRFLFLHSLPFLPALPVPADSCLWRSSFRAPDCWLPWLHFGRNLPIAPPWDGALLALSAAAAGPRLWPSSIGCLSPSAGVPSSVWTWHGTATATGRCLSSIHSRAAATRLSDLPQTDLVTAPYDFLLHGGFPDSPPLPPQ